MIALIRGTLVEKGPGWVVVDAGGVGYEVHTPSSVPDRIGEVGSLVELRTHLDVREGVLDLYGFLDRDEVEVFRALIGVNRVGPRLAIKVLSALTPRAVVDAIVAQDADALESVPGLGAETARRLIVDLARKVRKLHLAAPSTSPLAGGERAAVRRQAQAALRQLGYRAHEIEKGLDRAMDGMDGLPALEEVVKRALSHLARDR
jgi:Holliday junction DNA helicase RuvA